MEPLLRSRRAKAPLVLTMLSGRAPQSHLNSCHSAHRGMVSKSTEAEPLNPDVCSPRPPTFFFCFSSCLVSGLRRRC